MITPEQEHLMGSNKSVGSFVGNLLKPDTTEVSKFKESAAMKKKLQQLSTSTANLTKQQIDFIKSCPKNLVKNFDIQAGAPTDYLSESSVDDNDFEIFK